MCYLFKVERCDAINLLSKEGDESPHVVFVDSNYGKVAPETDIFENGSEICTLSCPTSKSLFDFKVAAAQE